VGKNSKIQKLNNSNSIASETKAVFGLNFVKICFHILFFVTPLLLWPFTTEVFEFNKMMFVYAMTVIILSGWLVQSFINKKIEIARTPLDLPILLFFLSQLASTVLSIDPHTSLWGYYSRFHGGLISTISYILLFYAFVSNFKNDIPGVKSIIKTILATATLTAFYGILEHFGIDKHIWVQDVQNRVFSTLGQPNWLSAYLIALLPIPLYFAISNKKHISEICNLRSVIYIAISLIYLIAIIFTKSQSGIGATAIILLLFSLYVLKIANKIKYTLLFIPIFAIIFLLPRTNHYALRTLRSLNNINPFNSTSLAIAQKENETRGGGSDSMIIRRVVWDGAIKLGQKYPYFGSGVETFGYSYYGVRPIAHNFTSETDFLYNKAHNEYLNFLANTGFIGLATYLFLIFSILKIFIKRSENFNLSSDISTPLLLGIVSILITNYFGFSVVNIGLFFFLFPAILISTINPSRTKHIALNTDPIIPILITILLGTFCLLKVKNIWLADIYYGKGKGNLEANEKAVKLNPSEPLYLSQLGYIQSLVSVQVIYPQLNKMATAESELKQKAQNYFNQYVSDSIKNTQSAVNTNRWNLNLYKNKARTELTLATLDAKYNNQAINTLLKIIELSPTDPANFYNLGILYKSTNQLEEATKAFEKSLELYPLHQGSKDQLQLLISSEATSVGRKKSP
jgi:putative inorganic carbon (hco3(-)) transporter